MIGCVLQQQLGAKARFAEVNLVKEMFSDRDAVILRNSAKGSS